MARFGGDEFVIVCHDILDEGQATRIAERVAATTAKPSFSTARRVAIRASIGVVLGRSGATAEALVNDADAAMYEMKRASPVRDTG